MEIVQRLRLQINKRIFCQQKLQCRLTLCRRRRGRHRRRHHHHRHSMIQHGKVRVVQQNTQSNLHVSRAMIVRSIHREWQQRTQRSPHYQVSYQARTMYSCHQHNKNMSTMYEREKFHERS